MSLRVDPLREAALLLVSKAVLSREFQDITTCQLYDTWGLDFCEPDEVEGSHQIWESVEVGDDGGGLFIIRHQERTKHTARDPGLRTVYTIFFSRTEDELGSVRLTMEEY